MRRQKPGLVQPPLPLTMVLVWTGIVLACLLLWAGVVTLAWWLFTMD